MAGDAASWPLVSIGIPLYRSRRFVDLVADNLERLSYPNLEILIADQHCEDDALAELESRFAADPRIRFFATRDRLSWSDNYNFLLLQARGRYFRWLAHDDSLPSRGLDDQVACLEENPETVLVYGPIERVDMAGRSLEIVDRQRTFPFSDRRPWGLRQSLLILAGLGGGFAFKGLFRRLPVIESGFLIRPTHANVAPERVWAFAISLLGRFRFVPGRAYRKRVHADGVSAGYRKTLRHLVSCLRVGFSYLRDRYPPGPRRWLALPLVAAATCVRIFAQWLAALSPRLRLGSYRERLLGFIRRRA